MEVVLATSDKQQESQMRELLESVVCDFSSVSRRWGYRWSQIELDAPMLSEIVNSAAPEDATEEETHKIKVGQRDARQQLREMMDEQNRLMAQVLRDVPRAFLVADAPDVIDWSDGENILDWVREDCIGYVVLGISLAKGESAKNLPTLMPSNGSIETPQ
jgi:hypothetical protein